jgi:A/G-specific adenine glycosylase
MRKAESFLPEKSGADYTQAIMDLGATVCTRSSPKCLECPVKSGCVAFAQNRVDQLPSKKVKRIIPIKERYFLIMIKNDQVLFQQRPSMGIWGGLWSFPEVESFEKIKQSVGRITGDDIFSLDELDAIPHLFSHFKLVIKPVVIRLDNLRSSKKVMELEDCVWYKYQQIPKGLPSPVTKIKEEFLKKYVSYS